MLRYPRLKHSRRPINMSAKPIDVRSQLVEALRLDLVGPENGTDLEAEILPQAPSRWYLTGFLVPLEAGEAQKSDETAQRRFRLRRGRWRRDR